MTKNPSTTPTTAPEIADRLHSTAIHLLRLLRQQDESSGLGPAKLSALSVVVFAGPVTATELARAEQVRPPTISRLVKDLEREGLVERRTDESDRRVQHIRATGWGRTLLRRGRERRVALLTRKVSELSERDRRTLARAAGILDRISRPD